MRFAIKNIVIPSKFDSCAKIDQTKHISYISTDIAFSKPNLFSMVSELLIMSLVLGSLVGKGASGKTINYSNSNVHWYGYLTHLGGRTITTISTYFLFFRTKFNLAKFKELPNFMP